MDAGDDGADNDYEERNAIEEREDADIGVEQREQQRPCHRRQRGCEQHAITPLGLIAKTAHPTPSPRNRCPGASHGRDGNTNSGRYATRVRKLSTNEVYHHIMRSVRIAASGTPAPDSMWETSVSRPLGVSLA